MDRCGAPRISTSARGQHAQFVEGDIGAEADAALARAARDGVLDRIAGIGFQAAIVGLDGDVDGDFLDRGAQDFAQTIVQIEAGRGLVKAGFGGRPRVFLNLRATNWCMVYHGGVQCRGAPSKRSGAFTLSRDTELYGELLLAGAKTTLYLRDKRFFPTHDIPNRCIVGVLHDLTKVTLINCVAPGSPSSRSHGVDSYHYASIFPHFVALGDHHLRPDERVIAAADLLIDDANILFCDYDAFGWLMDARPFIEEVADAAAGRPVTTGPDPQIVYFTGKRKVFTASTALGTISAFHGPLVSMRLPGGGALRSRIMVSIAFEETVDFATAMFRVRLASNDEASDMLRVYWSMAPKRDSSSRSNKPDSSDILLDAVRQPQEFSRVLERWIGRQADWRDARYQFVNSFSRQRSYDIDRLIRSTNMFDILPKSAVPHDVPIGDDLKCAQLASRALFRALPLSRERNSILSALGRIGESNLKHKVSYRAKRLVEGVPEWFPDLVMVTDEAVNCRNHYVHGTPPRFGYNRNFAAVVFFSETLEFVFGASDLIDAGWDLVPVTEKLDPIPHTRHACPRAKMQYPAQLLAYRESLLRHQDDATMFAAGAYPLRVKPTKIGDVEGVKDASSVGREGQLFLVASADQTDFQHRDHVDVAGSQSRDQIGVHSVLVEIDFERTHG
jgi:hypothetical protein